MSDSPTGAVLVVDDDKAVATVLVGLLRQAGHEASMVHSGDAALARVSATPPDVLISDLRMPSMSGLELLAALRERALSVPVIVLTAHGSVEAAVEAMKLGAADFLSKPFDRDEVLFTVGKAMRASQHAAERVETSAAPAAATPSEPERGEVPWLGDSAAMREVSELVRRAASASSTVLIRGESGAGKEVVARAIHAASARHAAPFIPVHCAALPENLLESELFGYERGAFTGATQRKPGRVELADGGTLFLDEIGDISGAVQVKLLRLLQEKEYERLGGTERLSADVRFVAATHRDLDAMVEAGEFREDLFYRLDVIPVAVPPLRERPADVAPLATRFVRELSAANGRPAMTLSAEALARLAEQPWPGNVRELSNFIERLVVFGDGETLGEADVERELSRRPRRSPGRAEAPQGLGEVREEAEHAAIREALERAGGNRTQAARLLGISRRTLYNKLAELPDGGAER